MFRRSILPMLTRVALNKILEALYGVVPVAEVFDGAKVQLIQAAVAPHPDLSSPAAYTIADFGGYADVTPAAWIQPVNGGQAGQAAHTEANFTADNTIAEAQTIHGYIVTVGAAVYAVELFEEPIVFAAENDSLSLDVVFQMPFEWPVTL